MKTAMLGTILLTSLLFATTATADNETQRKTLAGFRGIYVSVESIDPEVERAGLSESAIQTDAELKLRLAGITVLTREQWLRTPGNPWLYLNVNVHKDQLLDLYMFCIHLQFEQEVTLTSATRTMISAPTWQARGILGVVGIARLSVIRDDVRDMVDEFINAYLAANPKR
jgi:hypothetical protein